MCKGLSVMSEKIQNLVTRLKRNDGYNKEEDVLKTY
jgi:hypothetical protein